jgi:hypothetical protein
MFYVRYVTEVGGYNYGPVTEHSCRCYRDVALKFLLRNWGYKDKKEDIPMIQRRYRTASTANVTVHAQNIQIFQGPFLVCSQGCEQRNKSFVPVQTGSRDSVVVKALHYKPEGRRFETRWGEWLSFNLPNPSGRARA